jgi:hypothetical protein
MKRFLELTNQFDLSSFFVDIDEINFLKVDVNGTVFTLGLNSDNFACKENLVDILSSKYIDFFIFDLKD